MSNKQETQRPLPQMVINNPITIYLLQQLSSSDIPESERVILTPEQQAILNKIENEVTFTMDMENTSHEILKQNPEASDDEIEQFFIDNNIVSNDTELQIAMNEIKKERNSISLRGLKPMVMSSSLQTLLDSLKNVNSSSKD